MKAIERLPQLPEELALGEDQRAELARFLLKLVHDINNPLGTMSIELANLLDSIEDLRQHAAGDGGESPDDVLEELGEVHAAIEKARERTSFILDTVHGTGKDWLGEGA
jgi:signal transduction histidine kinase